MNYKLGKDLGVEPIKFSNHFSNKQLDDLIYRVNDGLFFFRNLYITPKVKTFLMGRLNNAEKATKLISFNSGDNKLKRRDEFINNLYRIRTSLSNYGPSDNEQDLKDAYSRMSKFKVANYLKQRDELTPEAKLKQIFDNKTFAHFFEPSDSLKSVQNELLENFKI